MSNEATPGQEPTTSTPEVAPKAQDELKPESTPPPKPGGEDRVAILEAELKRARAEAAQYRTKARETAEAKKKADEAGLAEQGKHKELAEARAKEIEALKQELEPLRSFRSEREEREAAERARHEAQVAQDFAALPEDVRARVPVDADPRTKEIAVSMYGAGKGVAPPKPPTTPATAPRPAPTQPQAGLLSDEERSKNLQIKANPRLPREEKRKAEAALAADQRARAAAVK